MSELLIEQTVASFAVFVVIVGSVGYVGARLLERVLPLSARTRQLLYLAVAVLPVTTFLLDMAHWTDVCVSLAARLLDVLKADFWLHSRGVFTAGLVAALLYFTFRLVHRPVITGWRHLSTDEQDRRRVAGLLAELGAVGHQVRVYRTVYPFACVTGLTSPVYCVSTGLLQTVDDKELTAVLAHELAHVQAKDNMLNLAMSVLRHVTFFSPVSHLAANHYARAREEAADDLAAQQLGGAVDLASALVKTLRRIGSLNSVLRPTPAYSSFLESDHTIHRAERMMSGTYRQQPNVLLEQGILFAATAIVPMLFC